jgi:hypothetical protein
MLPPDRSLCKSEFFRPAVGAFVIPEPKRGERGCAWLLKERKRGRFPRSGPAPDLCGRYWDRTSDLFGVNEALSR